jgi:hypothetical protein
VTASLETDEQLFMSVDCWFLLLPLPHHDGTLFLWLFTLVRLLSQSLLKPMSGHFCWLFVHWCCFRVRQLSSVGRLLVRIALLLQFLLVVCWFVLLAGHASSFLWLFLLVGFSLSWSLLETDKRLFLPVDCWFA